jgi:hypothetical protein
MTCSVNVDFFVLVGDGLVVLGRLHDCDLRVRAERLHHALGDEPERPEEGERQQDVERRAREIDPEVADRLGRASGESTDQRDGDRHARRRRHEVLHGQREHLREIAHGRLAAVALPVGVRREAHRGVEGGVRRDRAEPGRVERQHALHALERVRGQEPGQVEEEHRQGVDLPTHLRAGRDAGRLVDEPLEPAQRPTEHDRPALIHASHVCAERLGQREQDDEIKRDLQDSVASHAKSSGLRRASTR